MTEKRTKVILTSNSPRRKELLSEIIPLEDFVAIGSNITENNRRGEDAEAFTIRMAEQKARDVMRRYRDKMKEGSVIIGADTVILFKGEIIGQPRNKEDAVSILKKLSGYCHEVITGVAVISTKENRTNKFAVRSKVWMHELSNKMIEKYIESGEPMDKAGAYAIQGLGKELVETFEGSYTNIIGLPVDELRKVLHSLS